MWWMREYVSERDEFLLSQLLDGDLPEAEAAALRVRLENESALRSAYEVLCRVDGLVRARAADQPAVDYERFHEVVMQRLGAAAPVSEQDEYLLSRLLDGELAGEARAGLVARLEVEPALRDCYESHQRVNAALAERRADVPVVDYGRFHTQVMEQVREEAGRAARTIRFPVWARIAAPLAAAAAIALAVWLQPGIGPVSVDSPPRDEVAQLDNGPAGGADNALADAGSVRTVAPVDVVVDTPAEPVVVVMTRAPGASSGTGTMAIQVGRPAVVVPQVETIQVSYARSYDIAEAVQKGDDERARQPARKVFIASAKPSAAETLAGDLF
jgi:anti-sigma factor RsiW